MIGLEIVIIFFWPVVAGYINVFFRSLGYVLLVTVTIMNLFLVENFVVVVISFL